MAWGETCEDLRGQQEHESIGWAASYLEKAKRKLKEKDKAYVFAQFNFFAVEVEQVGTTHF